MEEWIPREQLGQPGGKPAITGLAKITRGSRNKSIGARETPWKQKCFYRSIVNSEGYELKKMDQAEESSTIWVEVLEV